MPWWGVVSSVLAPVLLIGGWTAAADLQPIPFDPVSRSISALAAQGMPYRWLITTALLGVGACHIATGLALRPAAEAGRVMLVFGGVSGLLIATNPQHSHSGSVPHVIFSATGAVLMALWPLAGMRQAAGTPFALRPSAAWAYGLVTLGLLLWFTGQLANGTELGLAERAVTADQSIWPLVVVVSVLLTQRSRAPVAEEAPALRSG
ncbi:MAG TPA: DUF998 domain-containing protein [Streptosporangiaceae bacterium]|nr:DUF998 domain-containing protein [Streptosporangiaceae bacterium]